MKFTKRAQWFYHGDDLFLVKDGASIPKWYGLSYTDFLIDVDVYYPLPINYVVRCWRRFYWRFLKVVYWVGLIDIGEAEVFWWGAFYRIKVH